MRPGIRMDADTKSSAFKVKCPVQNDEPTLHAGNVKLMDDENKFSPDKLNHCLYSQDSLKLLLVALKNSHARDSHCERT